MSPFLLAVFTLALAPCVLFCWNLFLYREPPAVAPDAPPAAISVLIPARNEEIHIAAAIRSVLASTGVDLELLILDDGSSDNTAAIVRAIAAKDSRLRLLSAPPLPAGWNGKQHACQLLAAGAHHDLFCFLDADVRLAPDALLRTAALLRTRKVDLLSGVPGQEADTFLEQLLIPLIHFVLLGYLPISAMRAIPGTVAFAAGCGQFLLVRREAYFRSGGHAAIRQTMHDGLLLPRLLRRSGAITDLADLTRLADCHMYNSAGEVWRGLSKNATEGMAAPALIAPFTMLLLFGQIAPALLATMLYILPGTTGALFGRQHSAALIVASLVATLLPRVLGIFRFRQSVASAVMHPIGVAVLLALQWTALLRKLAGRPAVWKSRAYTNP